MQTLRDSVYILVAIGSVALAACQPSESAAGDGGNDVKAAQLVVRPADKLVTHVRLSNGASTHEAKVESGTGESSSASPGRTTL